MDYVQDITEEGGEHSWISPPPEDEPWKREHYTPTSVSTARALHQVGVTTPAGLAIVADLWRTFRPAPETRFPELSHRIRKTLRRVMESGLCADDDPESLLRTVVGHWPFPLWPLDLRPASEPSPADLRKERRVLIEEFMEVDSQRDPPPQVARSKVEALSKVYEDWMLEEEEWANSQSDDDGVEFFAVPERMPAEPFESYVTLQNMLRQLTLDERMDLAALAWFGRERQSGWEFLHAHARRTIVEHTLYYECGLGRYWLSGLERWESSPEVPASLRSSGGNT